MKILVGQGYYDLATPHFAAWYTLNHMDIDPELASNIQTADYEAGHMFYLDLKSLGKLKDDVTAFLKASL
jgi:carboxypeptidase C (cathepsin A)